MSITDELREYTFIITEEGSSMLRRLTDIADRIDAEHEDAVRKKAARMLTKTSEYMNDDDLAEIGLVRLPVDADGVPIRVGNEVETIQGKRDEVRFMTLNGAGWMINEAGWLPMHLRHYAIDTWESIISDAVKLGFTDPDNEHLADKLVSRCKALAGGDK